MYNIFYISLLEHDTSKKGQINKIMTQVKFEADDNSKEYGVKEIRNKTVYAKELKSHLLDFYYLALWKSYSEEENI